MRNIVRFLIHVVAISSLVYIFFLLEPVSRWVPTVYATNTNDDMNGEL